MVKIVKVEFVKADVKKHSVRYNQANDDPPGNMSVYVTLEVLAALGGSKPAPENLSITFSVEQ